MKPPGITVVYHPDHSITLSDGKGAEVTYRDPDTVGASFEQALESMPSSLERTVTAAGVVSLVALVVVLCVRFVF